LTGQDYCTAEAFKAAADSAIILAAQ
jgi:hypothetical protein